MHFCDAYIYADLFYGALLLLLDYEQKQQEDSGGHREVQEGKAEGIQGRRRFEN
jgi:hypothetical protein